MERLENVTFQAYVELLVARENQKAQGNRIEPPSDKGNWPQWCASGPLSGKYLDWYPGAKWSRVRLDYEDFRRLMVLDGVQTRSEGLVVEYAPRTLENAATLALTSDYFRTMKRLRERHYWYYLQFIHGGLRLAGDDRLVVRSVQPDEWGAHHATPYSHYLQDGWGRSLPYMVLLLEKRVSFEPVEAYLAER
jgi:hypothetical protein